jgi:hypothetical protein
MEANTLLPEGAAEELFSNSKSRKTTFESLQASKSTL